MAQPAAAKVANPGPLGLLGFGMTTLVLSLVNTNIFGTGQLGASTALPLALIFGGGAQILAGMWEFHAGNTFGATAFTGFGAFWISFYVYLTQGTFAKDAGPFGTAVFLLGWTLFTLVIFFGAVRVNMATTTLIGLLLVTFAALTAGAFTAANGGDATFFNHAGGFIGILTAANAFYNAAAGILKDLAGRDILPV